MPDKGPDEILRCFVEVAVHWFPTLADLELRMRSSTGPVITVLVAPEKEKDAILHHLREVERLNSSNSATQVRSLVLLEESASPELFYRIKAFGAETLPLESARATIEPCIRLLLWELAPSQKALPIIRVLFSGSDEVALLLVGKLAETELIYRGKLLDLFEILDHRWRTKKYLAEHTGISVSSINEYIKRLRDEFDAKRRSAGVSKRGKDVFQSQKIAGIWLYRLMATIVK